VKRLGIGLAVTLAAVPLLYGAAFLYYHAGSPRETCQAVARSGGAGGSAVRLDYPMGLAWANDLLYVADTEDGSVELYRADGSLASRWTGFQRPVAVAVSDSVAYVADFLADQVVRVGPGGTVLGRWGRHGTGPGEFDAPAGVAVDDQGNVFVSDLYNHWIQKFDASGRFLAAWGGKGRASGRFRYPAGVAVSRSGEVFVADAFNNRVQVFTRDGRYLRQWGGVGLGLGGGWPGWFRLAKEIALDRAGNVYVADAFNGRVQKFTPEGDLLAVWDPDDPDVRYPSGLAVGSAGILHVSGFYAHRVWTVRCQ
jgi:tripartite motif-containing protein 71